MAWDVTNGFAVFGKRKFWSVNNIFVFCVNMVLMLDKIIISTIQTQFMLRPLFSFSDSKSHRYPHVRQHTDSPQHYCVSHCHSLARPQTLQLYTLHVFYILLCEFNLEGNKKWEFCIHITFIFNAKSELTRMWILILLH